MTLRRRLGPLLAVSLVGLTTTTTPPHPPAAAVRPDGVRTVFVVGDSLAATYAEGERPRAGWGQALPVFLAGRLRVANEAWPGASTRTYLASGRLDAVLGAVEPGDLVVVSFGHNDQMPDERHTDAATTYQQLLATYVDRVRAVDGLPVLVTPVERRRFDAAGRPYASLGGYPDAMREVAARTGAPLVDLTAASAARWAALGPAGTREEFLWLEPGEVAAYPSGVHDGTHLQVAGAVELARLVARDLRRQRLVRRRDVGGLGGSYDGADLTWPDLRPSTD